MNLIALCVMSLASLGSDGRGYVLEFSSPQCGPCQQVAPTIAKLEREGQPIRTINVLSDQAAAEQYQITSIPAFLLFVDGKEVDRVTGYQTESQIRQMLARIPATSPGRTAVNNGGPLPISLGESAPIPRPDSLGKSTPRAKAQDSRTADREGGHLWPFSKPKQTPAVVRGKDPEPMPRSDVEVLPASPMDASARLRVITGGSEVKGSGTVIESRPGRTVILTCSHVLRGATDKTRVEVDLFRDGKPTTFLASIIGSDAEADVGLISVSTADESFPAIPVARHDQTPAPGTQVVSIGCGGGELPSREQLRVTEINRYKGPDTLVCTGVPVMGRSGGGLFDGNGSLIGVCFAADENGKRGVYCGLRPIHDLLTKNQLAHLVPRTIPAESVAQTENTDPASSEAVLGDPDPMPSNKSAWFNTRSAAEAATPTSNAEGSPASEVIPADDAEVVVVIRSRTAGPAGDKVILIHKPSRQFLNFVQGELGDASESQPLTHRDCSPAESRITRSTRPRLSDSNLQPTGLPSRVRPTSSGQ